MSSHLRKTLSGLLVIILVASVSSVTAGDALPDWFEGNRVQAHFENGIADDLSGLYQELHPVIRSMGSEVLTRIFKTTEEGAWWPTEAGYTHEALNGRDLGKEIAEDAHRNGLKVLAYYRIMCDDFVEKEHPEWLCRDASGELVLEPRTRRRRNEEDRKHIICFNSPARDLIQTRLLELADRGVDGIYFDSWHMPEVCTCENCQIAFEKEFGHLMVLKAARGSDEYMEICGFVARSMVRNFRQWKTAVKKKHPNVIFAIGSSLYPCFDKQMQMTASLLRISDTSKTEFSKPFGGFLMWPIADSLDARMKRMRPYFDDSFDLFSYDLQNALGWSLTRDSCDGRPALMWIPFTRTEQEALFSTAASVAYGCVASLHPTGVWTRRSRAIDDGATKKYASSYELGRKVSPWLARSRPYRFAVIHISERSRNARISDPRASWVEFFAPILGAFETLKEQHLPVATVDDLQLEQGIPAETRIVIVPHAEELSEPQRAVLKSFADGGGTVIRLSSNSDWHLKSEKPRLKRAMLGQLASVDTVPPIQAHGPAAMHSVFYQCSDSRRLIACLVNDFGWFRSERDVRDDGAAMKAPTPCRNVVIEVSNAQRSVRRALEVVTGTELTIHQENGKTVVAVPDFPVTACVVIE